MNVHVRTFLVCSFWSDFNIRLDELGFSLVRRCVFFVMSVWMVMVFGRVGREAWEFGAENEGGWGVSGN